MSHRNRNPNRLQHYEYSETGYYLVTICTQNRANYFGEIKKVQVELNDIGQTATGCWRVIPEHFRNTELGEFVVMPNHIHGIIVIKGNDFLTNNGDGVENNDRCSSRNARNMELFQRIVSQYNSSVTRMVRKRWNNHIFSWQKSFYDRIIGNDGK